MDLNLTGKAVFQVVPAGVYLLIHLPVLSRSFPTRSCSIACTAASEGEPASAWTPPTDAAIPHQNSATI